MLSHDSQEDAQHTSETRSVVVYKKLRGSGLKAGAGEKLGFGRVGGLVREMHCKKQHRRSEQVAKVDNQGCERELVSE